MKLISSIAGAILFTISSSDAQAVVQYRITDLGTLGGTSSRAYGINNVGDIVGRSRPANPDGSNGTRSAFLYTNGQMLDIGNFSGSNTIARDSNFSRQVVGYSRPNPDSSEYNAFLYEKGELKNLGTLGTGNFSYAYGINESGTIVGHSHTNESGTTSEAFIYENGVMKGIGTLGGKSAGAFAINDQGVITGTSTTTDANTQGFIYQNGVMTSLGSLENTGFSEARAINNNNQIVGNSLTESGSYHTFLYEDGVMKDLGSIEGDSFAYDINIDGQIVGGYRSSLLEGNGQAYLYSDGEMFDLTSLLSDTDQEEWDLTAAFGINDKGQIVGWGSIGDESHAYLLTAVPLPASISLMMPALGLLGFLGKRRKLSE